MAWRSCARASVRAPRMPNQFSPLLSMGIVAFALAIRVPVLRASPPSFSAGAGGGLVVSHNGVWRCLRRHGLDTRQKRLSLVSGYAAPYEPPRAPEPERHVEAEGPGELVDMTASTWARSPTRKARSERRSARSRVVTCSSAPVVRRRTGRSSRCTSPCSRNAGARAFVRYLNQRFTGLKPRRASLLQLQPCPQGSTQKGRIPAAEIAYGAGKVRTK